MNAKPKAPHPDRARLQSALNARDQAEITIKEILAANPGRNKTTVMYQILGLCPNCGDEREDDGYYCRACRKKYTAIGTARYRKNKKPAVQHNPPDERYNNDNH